MVLIQKKVSAGSIGKYASDDTATASWKLVSTDGQWWLVLHCG